MRKKLEDEDECDGGDGGDDDDGGDECGDVDNDDADDDDVDGDDDDDDGGDDDDGAACVPVVDQPVACRFCPTRKFPNFTDADPSLSKFSHVRPKFVRFRPTWGRQFSC